MRDEPELKSVLEDLCTKLDDETPKSGSYRIIVCIDVDANSAAEAYGKITAVLCAIEPELVWESSDEWYGPDGGQLSEEAVSAARQEFFDDNREAHER